VARSPAVSPGRSRWYVRAVRLASGEATGQPHCADQGRRSRDTFHPRPPAGRPWDRVLIAKAGLTVEEFLAAARDPSPPPPLAAERAGSVPRLSNPFPPPPTWHTVSDSRCEASEVP